MSTKNTWRFHQAAGPVTALASLPKGDAADVQREVAAGTDAKQVGAIIARKVATELEAEREKVVPVPKEFEAPADKKAWAAITTSGAGATTTVAKGSPKPPKLDDALPVSLTPFLDAEKAARKEKAAIEGPTGVRLKDLAALIKETSERLRFGMAELGTSAQLGLRKLACKRWLWVFIAVEVLLGVAAGCVYVGGGDATAITEFTVGNWLEVVSFAVPATITQIVLAIFAARLIRRLAPDRSFVVALAAATVVALVLFGAAQGYVRYLASLPPDEVSETAELLGSTSILLVVGLASVVMAGAVVYMHLKIDELDRALAESEKVEKFFQHKLTELNDEKTALENRVKELEHTIKTPDRLRGDFERAVLLMTQRLKEEAEIIAGHRQVEQLAFTQSGV